MQNVIVNTRAVGYKGQDKTKVAFSYHFETRSNDFCADLLGDTMEVVVFDTFEVEGLDVLASNFEREGLDAVDAKAMTLKHLQGLVKDSIQVFSEYQRQSIACIVKAVL